MEKQEIIDAVVSAAQKASEKIGKYDSTMAYEYVKAINKNFSIGYIDGCFNGRGDSAIFLNAALCEDQRGELCPANFFFNKYSGAVKVGHTAVFIPPTMSRDEWLSTLTRRSSLMKARLPGLGQNYVSGNSFEIGSADTFGREMWRLTGAVGSDNPVMEAFMEKANADPRAEKWHKDMPLHLVIEMLTDAEKEIIYQKRDW